MRHIYTINNAKNGYYIVFCATYFVVQFILHIYFITSILFIASPFWSFQYYTERYTVTLTAYVAQIKTSIQLLLLQVSFGEMLLRNIIHSHRRIKKLELVVYEKKSSTLSYFSGTRALLFWIWYTPAVAGRVSNCFHFVVTWNFSEAFSLTSDAARTAIKPLSRWSASSPAKFYMARQTHDAHQNTPHYAVLMPRMEVAYQKVLRSLHPAECEFIAGSSLMSANLPREFPALYSGQRMEWRRFPPDRN